VFAEAASYTVFSTPAVWPAYRFHEGPHMSLFGWFSRKKTASTAPVASDNSGLLNADATRPLATARNGKAWSDPPSKSEHAANRRSERMEQRELLYIVVRDSMVRAGVLSSSYKFKVLSLDQRGRQFLVMMDLAREYADDAIRLSEIEALMAQTAKARYDILVTAVYWRINDHVAVGVPQRKPPAPSAASAKLPAAVPPPQGTPTAPAGTKTPRYEPIAADEVAAFKRALANSSAAQQPLQTGQAVRSGPRVAPTQPDDAESHDHSRPQELSNTQYGDLD
jgi:hypothetical protein